MNIALALHQWADIAQLVIATTAVLALIAAVASVLTGRANARRVRVYEYSDRFNQPDMRRRAGDYREYVEGHTVEEFEQLKRADRNELLVLPNVIEEVAALYHRKQIDRDVAAETLGVYIEGLWEVSRPFITEARAKHGAGLFCDWEEMQRDTPGRKLKADKKLVRGRAWHRLLRGAAP